MNQDEISSLDSYSSDGYEGLSPISSGPQTKSTQPNIIIEILFRPEIHQKPDPLYLSESLQLNSMNRGPRAKPIPKK